MTMLDRIAARFGYARAAGPARRIAPTVHARGFDAAETDNLTFGFRGTNQAIDDELVARLDTLRGRARTLAQNNDHAKKFLRMVHTNVVGPDGFKLQALAKDAGGAVDKAARVAIEDAFAAWAVKGTCEITGRLSFVDVQRVLASTVARDGEALLRLVTDRRVNRYGFALQVLDVDRLPTTLNGRASNGNRIRMGVEINDVGRPVAYHLLTTHPNGGAASAKPSAAFERVDARDLLHIYTTDRPEQSRGIPWMHTAMLRLESLGKFERAALTTARKGAQTLGFFVSPEGDPPPGDDTDADGNQIQTSVEGEFDTLPPGYDFRDFDTKYPSDLYGDFVKACLRSLSAGLGVSYNALANDLSEVNFSSMRAGVIDERDVWMTLQTWFAEHVMQPVFRSWLSAALLAGAVGNLPATKFEKFAMHRWQPRRWQWVDPRADIDARLMAVRAGLDTLHDVAADQGKDFDDVVEQRAQEIKALAAAGVLSDLGGNLQSQQAKRPAEDATFSP